MNTETQPSPVPGPRLLELLPSLTGLRDNPLAFLQQAADHYGGMVRFQIGPLNAFLLTRPESIQYVLQDNNHNYTKDTIQYNALAEVTGRGLLTSDGETWLHQRRRMQPAFHRQRILGFGPLMVAAAENLADEWALTAGREQEVDVDQAMMKLALEILGKALLGVDLHTEAPALTRAVLAALDHVVHGVKTPSILPKFMPTSARRQFNAAMATLDKAVQEIIDAHRAKEASGSDPASSLASSLGSDLLTVMMRPVEGSPPMSDRQLRDELITILIAGHETVASALTWCCYLLARNPQMEACLHQELDRVLGARVPTVEDLPALDFTRRVFDEALRLYPPAWLVTRKNIKEDQIAGVHIPAGSLIVVGVSAMHHNPQFWPDPERFDPDRFLPEASAGRPRFAYLPFGGGPRLCIGNHFALTEAPLVLASLYRRYHLELDPAHEVIVDPLVTLRPRGGLPMRIMDK